jgi:hypothetical protein
VVQVRKDRVRGYLDGKLVMEWKTDYADLGPDANTKLSGSVLGLFSLQSPMAFYSVELLEVTGKGQRVRPVGAAPATPAAAGPPPPIPPGPAGAAFAKAVAARPAPDQVVAVVEKLRELNSGYEGTATHKIDKGVVTDLAFETDKVKDLSPVAALTGLQGLSCNGNSERGSVLTDLSPLRGMRLARLNISRTHVMDLSPLRGMPLKVFACTDMSLSDLSPLTGMALTDLDCGYSQVRDLSPLRGMPIGRLRLDKSPARDLLPLRGAPIGDLSCVDTPVRDLSPLRGSPLVNLSCQGSNVADFSPLKDTPIKRLKCSFQKGRDAPVFAALKSLEVINDLTWTQFWAGQDMVPPPK